MSLKQGTADLGKSEYDIKFTKSSSLNVSKMAPAVTIASSYELRDIELDESTKIICKDVRRKNI